MQLDYLTATKKDLFKARLEGEGVSFGLIEQEEYPDLLNRLIELEFVEYVGQAEHKGTLAQVKVLADFVITILDNSPRYSFTATNVELKTNDILTFTELLENHDYNVEPLLGIQLHRLYVKTSSRPEQRTKLYRKYNIDI